MSPISSIFFLALAGGMAIALGAFLAFVISGGQR